MKNKQQVDNSGTLLDASSQTIFQQSPISTQIFSQDGLTIMVNKAWEKLWQTNSQDIINHYNILKDSQLTKKKIMPYIKKAFTGKTVAIPAVRYQPDKTISGISKVSHTWVKAIMYPIKNQQGRGLLFVLQHEDVTKQKEFDQLLSEISEILSSSIDYATTLQNIGKVLIPALADYIRVVLVGEDKKIEDIVVFHKESEKLLLVKKLYDAYKDTLKYRFGVTHILQTGKSEIMANTSKKEVAKYTLNKKINKTVSALGLVSYMGVPLKLQKKVIGVITFSSTNKDKVYTKEDLQFAEVIARHIAYAVENARLYRNAQEIIEIEKKLAAIVTSSEDSIIGKDTHAVITTWNKGAEKMYGYTAEEVIGKHISLIVPKGKMDEMTRFDKKILLGKTVDPYITKGLRKDGQALDVSLTTSPVWDSRGKIIGSSTIGRDVTERIQAEKNLKFLSDTSKVLGSSLDYETTLANVAKLAVPEVADWCGVDMKTDKGILQLAVVHVDPKKVKWAKELNKKNSPDPHANTGVPHVIRTGKSEFYSEITDAMLMHAAKGEQHLALLRKLKFTSVMIVPMHVGKEVVGAISFVSAESGRHYTSADLIVAEEVAHRAAIAIENARLYTDARKAVTLRDDFIALASHELKTPITSLKMYAQSLTRQFEKRGDRSLLPYFEKMDQQTDKLSLLVNDLLNVSKIQHGKLEFTMEYIELGQVVKDIVDAVQETTKRHKIIIEGRVKKRVYADPYRIYQVLTNLLTNAVKYSPHADKIIVRLVEKKDIAVVTVQDFGIGIERGQQKKIFSQFYRVEDPEEKTFPGLGMGLFISQEIIKRHGGSMTVVSSKGSGSQFGFSLPYHTHKTK